MGIFGFKNKYDIVPKDKDLCKVVNKFGSVDVIKINSKIVVPSGYYFVIGKKGRVCDVFGEGEHYFNYASLPIMCRKYGIDKTKNGKVQDKIPADFYFVKKESVPGKFSTYRKVCMGTKAYGLFSTKVYGVYSYRVNNVSEYMQSLLNEYDYIKTGEAEDILERWVSEVSVNELEKQNFIIKDVIANSPIIADTLKVRMSKLFSVAGLELIELKIVKYKLPKKYQQMQNEFESAKNVPEIKVQEAEIKDIQPTEMICNENNQEQNYTAQQELLEKESELNARPQIEEGGNNFNDNLPKGVINEDDYGFESLEQDMEEAKALLKEFGIEKNEEQLELNQTNQLENLYTKEEEINSEKQNQDEQDIKNLEAEAETIASENVSEEDIQKAEQIKKETIDYVPFGDFVIEDGDTKLKQELKETKKEKTFVDLNVNELYNSKANFKRCINCGMENDINADHCVICLEKFSKGEQYD